MARDTHRATRTDNVLFPTRERPFNRSHVFEVRDKPVIIKAFNVPACVELVVEMGVPIACERDIWGPYRPNCCDVRISDEINNVILGVSGRYRLVVDFEDGEEDTSDMYVVQHELHSYEPVPHLCCCDCE